MPRKKIAKTAKKDTGRTANLKTDVYNLKGKVVGKTTLPSEIFAAEVSPVLVARAVRVYQANQRRGTHSTKTRSEVAGSTRKIYRQKGTGRARHGAITAPIFIGGGVAHGPHPRDYSLTLPQKMRKAALFGVLSDKLQNGAVKIVRGLEKIEVKTKKMNEMLINLKLTPPKNKKTNILLVTSGEFENVKLAGRNIGYLTVENAKLLNSFEVISHNNILFMEDAVPVLAGHFLVKKAVSPTSQRPVSAAVKSKKKEIKVSAEGLPSTGAKRRK